MGACARARHGGCERDRTPAGALLPRVASRLDSALSPRPAAAAGACPRGSDAGRACGAALLRAARQEAAGRIVHAPQVRAGRLREVPRVAPAAAPAALLRAAPWRPRRPGGSGRARL